MSEADRDLIALRGVYDKIKVTFLLEAKVQLRPFFFYHTRLKFSTTTAFRLLVRPSGSIIL